jgi:formamidopyrimidine-DNA glycosylase
MSGHLRILVNNPPFNKHDHIDICFRNNKLLRFTDPRRFGAFLWIAGDPNQHPLLKNLGVEPLTKHFSGKYLYGRAKSRTVPIKSFLMDSKIVTGIGNIYATEALFQAGIDPLTPAHALSLERMNHLTLIIKSILKHAIKQGGTTLKDFIKSDGKPGYFSQQLKAYGHAGLPCISCHTILQSRQIGQRNTVYCTRCQRR